MTQTPQGSNRKYFALGHLIMAIRILGISAYYHNSAAVLLIDGLIIAATQEERFSRKKHDARFPRSAIAYCLKEAGVGLAAVDHIVFVD